VTAADTNVIVRYLVQDDPAQGRKAATFIESVAASGEQILLANIVLCETVWVLDSAYGFDKTEIAHAMDKILQTASFAFEDKDLLRTALEDYRNSKADFADCLIGRSHQALECDTTVTFDVSLKGLPTFRQL
jgi:predicted nucleic-acid-binding protein